MQVPTRKKEQLARAGREVDNYLTPEKARRLEREMADIEERQRPQAAEDLAVAAAMGDRSENAAYSEARGRLSRLDARLASLRERLKSAVLIERGTADGTVGVGASVTVEANGSRRNYEILGSQEANPGRGRISHRSPLGSALIGRRAGESVAVRAPSGAEIVYRIVEVR